MSSAVEWFDESGWSIYWKPIGRSHVLVPEARVVVLDPRTSDWRRAVDDAMEHVRQLDQPHLRLVPNEIMGEM